MAGEGDIGEIEKTEIDKQGIAGRILEQSEVELTVGTEFTPNTVDTTFEKHVAVIEHTGDSVTVKVGSVAHPMLDAHWIG